MEKVVAILHERTFKSFIYTILLQLVLVCVFAFSNVDIFHPLSWIRRGILQLASLSVWIYFVILCSLLAALCGVLKTRILSGPVLIKSRIDKLRRIFSFNTIFQACLHVLIGVVVSCLYLSVIEGEYSNLRKSCAHSAGYCVSKEKVFLFYCGACAGFYVFLYNYFKSYAIRFPVIHQLVFLRLKAEVMPCLKEAMRNSVLPCFSYPFLYFVNGSVLLHIICDVFNLTLEDKLFDSFSDFLKLSLLFYVWLQTTILFFSFKMMEQILNIFLTDPPEFPIVCKFGEKNVDTLHEVIAASKYPVIQNWGCLDLFSLAKNDANRRKEIFALSQPGGHPNNWDAIRKECVHLIDNCVENINGAISEMMSSQIENAEVSTSSAPTPLKITKEMSPTMRNLALIDHEPSFQCDPLNEEPLVVWHQVLDFIAKLLKNLISPLLKKIGFNNLLDKFPDAKLKYIISNSLPVINAVQGLSFLVAASLTEDEYGVVRKDLNTIIISVLQLKLTVERAMKLGNFKRVQRNDHDVQMKAALKSALRRSIYKICIAFKDHMKELELPTAVYNNLHIYLTFKE